VQIIPLADFIAPKKLKEQDYLGWLFSVTTGFGVLQKIMKNWGPQKKKMGPPGGGGVFYNKKGTKHSKKRLKVRERL